MSAAEINSETNDKFEALKQVRDLRSVSGPHTRRKDHKRVVSARLLSSGDSSATGLAVIDRSQVAKLEEQRKRDRERRREPANDTLLIRKRQRWYQSSSVLWAIGALAVLATGVLTLLVVLLIGAR